jgi:hypothetical protein
MKPSDPNDVAIIATLLPYCDAIVLDNAWIAELRNNPAASECAKYETLTFSGQSMDKLMEYLDEIGQSAPAHILAAVQEVFGDIGGYGSFR